MADFSNEEDVNVINTLYCRGIGPKSAIKLVQEHKSIEEILKHIDSKKNTVPDNFLYAEARRLFKDPDVTKGDEVS